MIRCKKCNRPLKSESSIQLGYGLHCAKLEGLIMTKRSKKYKGVSLTKWIK